MRGKPRADPGTRKEFEVIYRREYPVALRFARRYLDDEAAEDAVQAVFMEYWEGYTRRPALAFGADAERTHAAILASVRNRMRSATRRVTTIGRKLQRLQPDILLA